MKAIYYRRNIGILLSFLILIPYVFIIPCMAISHTVYDNYEFETTAGVRNVYYQSGSAFQYVQEKLVLTNSTLRLIAGTNFYYHTNSNTVIRIQAVDDSAGVIASTENISILNSLGVKNLYTHYFLEDPYLISRGSHLIRLRGMSSALTSIHYTDAESGYSYYSNQTTGMGIWTLDSKQYFIQFIEEEIVNLSRSETKMARIDFPTNKDAIDAYLLNLPAQYVKIVLRMVTAGENLNMELYNYTNNGDMALENSTVKTSTNYNPEIIRYKPVSAGFHVLLIKPSNYLNDVSNYTIYWFNSSTSIQVSRPVTSFDNSSMKLSISGVTAKMDGFTYNGTSYQPKLAQYMIYRERDDKMMGLNGTLSDSGGSGLWSTTNIDVKGLNPGVYYVRALFEDNGGTAVGISPESNRFFVLGNLTALGATVDYLGGMIQKINVTNIMVYNTTSLDVFTYTVFDNVLKTNTSISGKLSFNYGTKKWSATNIDVSTLTEGSYFVLGYFEDRSAKRYGIGNISAATLDLFTIDHIINVNQIYISYTDQWAQSLKVGGLAKRSFEGHGTGIPVLGNEAIVSAKLFSSKNIYTGLSGNLSWTGTSWNATISVANLTEGAYYNQLAFTNNSQLYTATGTLNSSYFWVDHILNITSASQNYVDYTSQIVAMEIRANTSYHGAGIGTPITNNPNAIVKCTVVNSSTAKLTQAVGFATWNEAAFSWKANVPTSSLPEGNYYMMVNFSVISNSYNASKTANSTTFTITHVLTLYVPMPLFNPDTAILDIVGIIATDSYSGYNHINSTTVKSTYFNILNYTSKLSIGISGHLTYNPTYDDWRNTSIDLSQYKEGFYYIYVNITSKDVPEGAAANSTPFELVHKIVISGISLEYTAGFQQRLNITVESAISSYQYHTRDNISNANYRFYFRENKTTVLNPNLGGTLMWTGSKWQGLANISRLPAGEYYVVVNFADPTAANSKGSADTTNFTVIHTLNVSTPIISYINGIHQHLNISCYVNSTYYYQRNFNSSGFGSGQYRIHLSNGTPTSITGNLNWNGKKWGINNAEVSLLPRGSYRIACQFSAYYAEANSSLSNTFNVTHTITISIPTIIFNNETKRLSILHVTALSSFSTYGYLTNYTALTYNFEIFSASNVTSGISGQLTWNGSEWQLIDFDTPSLSNGNYSVKIYFNDTQTAITEISSKFFTVKYPEKGIDWVVIAVILLIAIAAAIVLFWTFFTETPAERGKET